MLDLIEKWHGFDRGRIVVDASIHAEYTSIPKVWTALAEYAVQNGLGMHVHLSETRSEHENCIAKYGMTPAAVFSKYGVFDVPTIAAHCVWVSEEDIAILAEKGVTAVNNPVSNMKLASGIAPVSEMIAADVNVALGTDSVASNNSHDMFEEIKAAALAQKVRKLDPVALTAEDALRMATVNGAKAQQRQGECGMIRPGMDADLIMLDFDRPHLTPCHNVISNLVYSARGSDVVMNMVRGKIIYKDGEFLTLDIEKIKHDVRKAADIF
jgi:5-methylthioadenosine/S-adenosylhomocysteine deaminase